MTPDKVMQTIQEAIRAYAEGEPKRALSLLDRVKKTEMSDDMRSGYLAARIAALDAAERAFDARQLLAKVIGDKNASMRMLTCTGNLLLDLGAAEHCLTLYREAARREPAEPGTHYNIALALRATGDLEQSIALFRKALEVDDTFYEAWAEMSQTYLNMQRVEDAAESMRRYLKLVPDDYVNWVAMGSMEAMLKDYDRAEDAYDRAAELEPAYSELWYNRGMTAHQRDDLEQARYCHERLVDVAEDSWEEAILRASICLEDNQDWLAWEALSDAIERADAGLSKKGPEFHRTFKHVYATSLEMMMEIDLAEQREFLKMRVIDLRMFDERVFNALRRFNGEQVSEAQMFSVLVAAKANTQLKQRYTGPGMPGPAGYCRVYGVIATDEVEARAVVTDFETRVNEAEESNIKDVRLVRREMSDEWIGIASVRGIYFHSDDDIATAIDQMADGMADDLQLPDEDE